MEDLRYPIGRFEFPESITEADTEDHIRQIAAAPAALREAVAGMTEAQLDTPYRPGGWTVRQVVHHVADSHLNSYVRFRLALTEEEPVIKPYDQVRWADLPDARRGPVAPSLALLDSLHERWASLLGSMDTSARQRRFRHPEIGPVRLDQNIALYGWHGRHHAAHITALRERERWGRG